MSIGIVRPTALLLLGLSLCVGPARAITSPTEQLADPALEARARVIGKELRCLVCQNQSIDDSDAELARDLRKAVRERVVAGDSDEQVLAWVTARYGEFVLLRPPVTLATSLLWFGPALLLVGGVAGILVLRRRRPANAAAGEPAPLTEAERARLRDLLGEPRT